MTWFRRFMIFALALVVVFPVLQPKAVANSLAYPDLFPDVYKRHEEINFLTSQGVINGYPDGTFKPATAVNRVDGVRILLKAIGITDFTAPDPKFDDVKKGTYGYNEIAKAVDLGIISGKVRADGSRYFDPNAPLTRGQMAKVIVLAKKFPLNSTHTFKDVPKNHPFANYVSTLANEGITAGYPDNTFKPNLTITREHYVMFIARMLNDDFKEGAVLPSFKLNKDYIYVREHHDDNLGTTTSTLNYQKDVNFKGIQWELWAENGVDDFYQAETNRTLYIGYIDSEYYVDLSYPLYKGSTFSVGSPITSTVTDLGLTHTVKAGTFENVVKVTSSDGFVTYYAPNVGLIESVYKNKTVNELVELKKK